MKIAIITSGILPVPAVLGGAVEGLVDTLLDYNKRHKEHLITVYSVYHPKVRRSKELSSSVNNYRYIKTDGMIAKMKKAMFRLCHRNTYYHYSIEYFLQQVINSGELEEYDVIILENRPGYALELSGKTKTRLVYHLHNDFLNSEIPHYMEMYHAAAKIITVSDYIRSRVATCDTNGKKCQTVYNGISLDAYSGTAPSRDSRSSYGLAQNDFVIVFSGRLIAEKGIYELIEAMAMLKDYDDIKLLVLGSSFYGNVERKDSFTEMLESAAEQIKDRIIFTGYIEHEDIPSLLMLADVAIAPSTWEEPFGMTIIEAQAAGLPVITTNRGGIPEVVTNQNAIIVPCMGDFVSNISKAILYLYNHPEERKYMGECAKQWVKKFSAEKYAENFFKAIGNL